MSIGIGWSPWVLAPFVRAREESLPVGVGTGTMLTILVDFICSMETIEARQHQPETGSAWRVDSRE